MHIDINSCFLSVEAVYRLQHGETIDLREIPCVVGGNEDSRHGIVLAKSQLAKASGIQTGEPIFKAKQKNKDLVVVPPRYPLYIESSNAMFQLLQEYTPHIQRFSIDENFLSFEGMNNHYDDYIKLAHIIKDRIKNELGFTVSIGLSNNKLLAKMGSDIKKPDAVTTLFPDQIKEKMWPLPVEDLFMVGRATAPKLRNLNIFTIGDLANHDLSILKLKLKSHGELIYRYANGIENSEVRKSNYINMKGIGNSTTTSRDITDRKTAHLVVLSLVESVGTRLRASGNCCRLVSVSVRDNNFINRSRQCKTSSPTDVTKTIANIAYKLFDELWNGEPLRHLGIHVSDLCTNEMCQVSFFDEKDKEKQRALDQAIDKVRNKYGNKAVVRSIFLHSGIRSMTGGIGEDDYPLMTSIL
jgi:DNA polymerase IV